MSEFRIQKAKTEAVVTLSDGASIRGRFFVAGSSATGGTPERVKDLLMAEPGFFPLEIGEADEQRTVLFNRAHVVMVTLAGHEEPQRDPGYSVATTRTVSMLLTNGTRLAGRVKVYCPQGHDRVSDYTRTNEPFRYIEDAGQTYIVNLAHVLELSETTENDQ